ncbi:MAG: hypothetical protein IH571_06290 [Acholeplasmataceae bacterium]|nr:hypothetical protein [Acholeplasmataceae bacterium]
MRLSKLLGVRRATLKARILTLGIIITGMLSLAFTVITFYGQNAGNFVMSVDYGALSRGISLSKEPDLSITSSMLMSDPISEARDMTYTWLKIEEVDANNGNYKDVDYEYIAYTFYLVNSGFETVDISYHIRITEVYNNLDSAIRILVIEDGVQTMYMKPDEPDEFGNMPTYPVEMPEAENFLSDTIVTRKRFTNFKPGNVKKFSVIVWLEGWDPNTNDQILGGMFKSQMNFSIDGFI